MRLRSSLLALSLLTASNLATAADVAKYDGFLCCNLRTDGSWISDSNYAEDGKRVLPVGTPVSVTGLGRNRVNLKIAGESNPSATTTAATWTTPLRRHCRPQAQACDLPAQDSPGHR